MVPDSIETLRERLSPERRALLEERMRGDEVVSQIPQRLDDRPPPASHGQERLWFLHQVNPGLAAYNMPLAARLLGPLDERALSWSLQRIVERHEALRTTFAFVGGRLHQVVASECEVALAVVPISDPARAREFLQEEAGRPFDLARGPLLRAVLVRQAAEEHLLLVTVHHAVFDAWSIGVFFRELATLYSSGGALELPEVPIQYGDYSTWRRSAPEAGLSYWKTDLKDAPTLLPLPTDRRRPLEQSFRGARQGVSLSRDLSRQVRAVARETGATPFVVLLAAFQALLHRISGAEDVVIGCPVAGRDYPELAKSIGFFVNTIALRIDASGDPSFRELLRRTCAKALQGFEHQDVPFERIVEEVRPERSPGHAPLFQVMFALQNVPLPPLRLPSLIVEPMAVDPRTSMFDLFLSLEDRGTAFEGYFEYSTDLFDSATVERLAGHFSQLLDGALSDLERPLSRLPLLTPREVAQLAAWNDTSTPLPTDRCLHELFQEQALRTPRALAATFRDRALTYAELDERATRVARGLRAAGLGTDVRVGLFVDRSLEMLVGLLAILKAGGAYVPLDPAYPRDRLASIMLDADLDALLIQTHLRGRVPLPIPRIVDIESADGPPFEHRTIDSADLAYLLYTSGSTGTPQGVPVTHRAVVNCLLGVQRQVHLTPEDVLLAVTTLSFDIATLELLLPLLVGARVKICPRDEVTDPPQLAAALEEATVMQATPTLWRLLVAAGWGGKCSLKALSGGEALSRDLADQLLGRCRALWNLYGPTETTIWSSIHRVEPHENPVPIGQPLANQTLHVLDRHAQPVPVGIRGELWIGGTGVAAGYWRKTSDKFREGLYRTADQARRRSDGSVEFLGRIDQQLKIRGYRIEPGEIESTIRSHPQIRDCVVVARDQRLAAFVLLAPNPVSVDRWKEVWDETYRSSVPSVDPALDTAGWIDSGTGLPVPEEEMREWADRAAERILSWNPQRLLEIGCGTGMLLQRIAPQCRRYVGTDLSRVAVDSLRRRARWEHVALENRSADDFSGIEPGSFDTVVLNSVVQYFPHLDYFFSVLEKAAEAVGPLGRVFLGDLRNARLREAFHTWVQLQRAPASMSLGQLRRRIRGRLSRDQELLIDPSLFPVLPRRIPSLRLARTWLKRGRAHNEITRFRYDVLLQVGENPHRSTVGTIPHAHRNLRLAPVLRALELVEGSSGPQTVGEVLDRIAAAPRSGVDPEDFGEEARCSDAGDDFFEVGPPQDLIPGPVRSWATYANVPVQALPPLREFLRERLPGHMIPSLFVAMDALPRTANGKVDRNALPEIEGGRPELKNSFVGPQTARERVLGKIWEQVLGISPIGIHDNFFDLGGASVLTMQVVAEAEAAGLPLRPEMLFRHPTIAELAQELEHHD